MMSNDENYKTTQSYDHSKVYVFIDPGYFEKIPMYKDKDMNEVVDSIQNDSIFENYIEFAVDTCIDNMIFVQPSYFYGGPYPPFNKGWIKLTEQIKLFVSPSIIPFLSNSFIYKSDIGFAPLYNEPTENSYHEYIDCIGKMVSVTDIYGDWVKVKYTSPNYSFEGWLSPKNQCSDLYNACAYGRSVTTNGYMYEQKE